MFQWPPDVVCCFSEIDVIALHLGLGNHKIVFNDLDDIRDEQTVQFVLDATQAILELAKKDNYKIQTMGALIGIDRTISD